jgi:hypothetical protein
MDLEWHKSSRSYGSTNCVEVAWKKSSRSSSSGQCVEVGSAPSAVYVRDTKDREGGMLAFDQRAWRSFMMSLRD